MTPTAEAAAGVPRFSMAGLREERQHVLLWQARGQTRVVVDGVTLTLTPGTALWVPVRTEHRFTTTPNSALLPMFFDSGRHRAVAATPTVVTIDSDAETLCLALIGSQYSLVQPAAALEEMVLAVVRAQVATPHGTAMPRSPVALRVARHVVLDPSDPRTLVDWATELHVSVRTLERLFLAETGLSWRRWRQAVRLELADHLLRTTTLHVTDVGRRVGFATPSAFSRAFRQHHGVTPTQVRGLAGSSALETRAGA